MLVIYIYMDVIQSSGIQSEQNTVVIIQNCNYNYTNIQRIIVGIRLFMI